MSKTSSFTTITPIPSGLSRETVMSTLRDHLEMIDLNPLVIERKPCKAPSFATPEEYHCVWYEITDSVSYLPGGLAKGKVTYHGCFNDLAEGLQTHVYAPLGLDIRSRWSLGGNLPGEPAQPVEIGLGIPRQGLYLREDVTMKCNVLMGGFVKKNLKNSHGTLVDRMIERAKITEVGKSNASLAHISQYNPHHSSVISTASSPSIYNNSPAPTQSSLATDYMGAAGRPSAPQYNKPLPSIHGLGPGPAENLYGAHTPPLQNAEGYRTPYSNSQYPQSQGPQRVGPGSSQYQGQSGYAELPSEPQKEGSGRVELPG